MTSGAAVAALALEVSDLSKTYPGVRALRGVSLRLRAGETHMLLGENGAGKSTLVKVLAGAVQPDDGARIAVSGEVVRIDSPSRARAVGISVIHQELNLVPSASAVTNMFLGRELRGKWGQLERRTMRQRALEALSQLEVSLDVDVPVERLSVAQQQLIEIARALLEDCKILILDEPTSALAAHEAARLGEIIGRLKQRGVAVLYITHRFEEVFALGDYASVFRDGELVGERRLGETDRAALIRLMVGRDVAEVFPERAAQPGAPLLQVQNLSSSHGIAGVSFEVRAGEIVALGGLMGAGRTEVARAIFGLDATARGELRVAGQTLPLGSIRAALGAGIALVPEDRKAQGLVLGLSVADNIALASTARRRGALGQISAVATAETVSELCGRLRIKCVAASQVVSTLSGGNQQKVVLAKWLATSARLFIFDEPTRGVDVGAKQEIYAAMQELVAQGAGILMISSELPELLGLADRVLVMCQGRISGELTRATASAEAVLTLATAFQSAADRVSA